ncbi:hypothetical protein DOS84_07860 [Flavobacterium aquariorum]|uniref:Bacteriophage T5 Orf172 DNA-binding domain-containing protein n=1 Tax=Flavobacterium aquariorum TaxID=2217670 RepID=A0A2W7U952_9FLAO|nr:GIY-YIG nuclease family protein [Flavobacterium aquariorum]PZX93859.1 hypothetical protein DOS84_07860 [Flavobacterium aquariorum]
MRLKNIFTRLKDGKPSFDQEKLEKENPVLWKKLKQQFDTGRQIVAIQLHNGLKQSNEKALRYYLMEYANRFIKMGPNSFPTSFNALEPFFIYNHHNSIIELVNEEESYGVSLIDFLDFVTEANFNLEEIDFYENIPEKVIYHFTFTTGFDEINFSNNLSTKFHVGSLSLVRQGNEVSVLLQAGESYDKQKATEYFSTQTRKVVEDSISPYKKSLGLTIDDNDEIPKVVFFDDREDLWAHSVSLLFDLEKKSIDIRNVARDENISFSVYTDDYNAVFLRDETSEEEKKEFIENIEKKLSKYNAVFDFAKYCMALPYYVFENDERIVDTTYETDLKSILDGLLSKRKYNSVPSNYKLYAKPFYYLESDNQLILKKTELDDESFNIEKSGYWKRIGIDEEGFDKKGRKIVGKTWVERNDTYYSVPKGITKIEEVEIYDNENSGYVYIMRQPTHEQNIFKIGLTKRNTETRSKELSNTSSVDKFFVINSYYTKDCVEAEKQIHNKLEFYRLSDRREFFRCDLRKIIDTCDKVIKEINA